MNDPMKDGDSLFPEADIKYASYGSRIGASLIDGLILTAIALPVTYYNIISWKMPVIFILVSLLEIIYKPFLEYRYGATLGKMAVGIQVLGHQFQKVSFNEEMKRVSFYMIPSILQFILTLRIYFSPEFHSTKNYTEFNQYVVNSNPALQILVGIILFLALADCSIYVMNTQRRALHDLYAGTYVVVKD